MDPGQLAALRTEDGVKALALAAELAGGDPLSAAAALRSSGVPPALAAAALTQAELRRRAAGKFGADAARMFFTRAGLEQATRSEVAERRAARLRAAGVRTLADLGCGIGADAIAAARQGIKVYAVDADPGTAAIAAANAEILGLDGITVQHADATTADLSDVDAVFCDPARRRDGRRIFDPTAYSPPWDFVASLPERVPRTVLKLAPGIDHALVPPGAEAEWVSVRGEVVEAAFWCGPLAEVPRRATLLPGGASADLPGGPSADLPGGRFADLPGGASADPPGGRFADLPGGPSADLPGGPSADLPGGRFAGLPGGAELSGSGTATAAVGPVGPYLYDPDGAVVRAHLVAEFAETVGGRLADPDIAYVYADERRPTPFARCVRIDDVLPFSLKRLRAHLRDRGVGRLEIMKRGSALEPEKLRRDLRLSGSSSATLVLTRVAGAPTALIGEALR